MGGSHEVALRLDAMRKRAADKEDTLKKKHQEEYKKVRTAVQAIASDPNAVIMLRHMAKICDFFKSSLVLNPTTKEVNQTATLWNEARRSVYLDFRRMMSEETKRQIEAKETDYELPDQS